MLRCLAAATRIPSAPPIRATRRPMSPSPTMPSVRPANSIRGPVVKQKSSLADHRPSWTARLCSAVRLVSSSSSANTCCATESLL